MKLTARSVEYNLSEHCNLACYACDHAAPLLPKRFAPLDGFSRDMKALARVFHARQLRLLGGEPLLHPRLLDFLAAARRAKVADELVVITNGVLLHKMPERFYKLIDRLWVSVYPGVKLAVDWPSCSALCGSHEVELRIEHHREFLRTLLNHPIGNARRVRRIFGECRMFGERGCPTVHEGRFYPCSVAPFMAPRLALAGVRFDNREADGVSLHENPSLKDDIARALTRPEPLSACDYCLGTSGPKVAHRQLNRGERRDWLKEDDRVFLESRPSRGPGRRSPR